MAPLTPFSHSLLTLLGLLTSGALSTTFTMVNKCGYAVWPGILSQPGVPHFPTTGFALQKGETKTLTAPASWRGRFWGRTLCTHDSTGNFSCVTGDCGSGQVACSGSVAAPPATLAEFTLGGAGSPDYFDVSLVDGYNLPMLVVPQGGTGTNCANSGCVVDLNGVCPKELQVTSAAGSEVVGCKSACEAFQEPQYCCTGAYATPETCKPSSYSQIFKKACPHAYSYTYDDNNSNFACASANYTITFCPCGSNATTDSFLCLYWDRPPNSTRPIVLGTKFNSKTKVFIGVAATIAGSCILLSVILFRWTSLIRENDNEDAAEAFVRNIGPLAVQRYKFSDVRKMTNSFKDKLGQGGYGDVYEGKLLNGCRVAVKVLKESKGNGEDFVNEVASISRTSHVNVVTLLGYCIEGKKKALVYEFMPNGSLEKFIYKDSNLLTTTPHLELEKLFQIAIGIARGLEYLHRGCNTRILHFDIKPQNILLDEDFCPKISDFGLSKLCTRKESIISMLEARGTIGYIAPEVFSRNFGRVSAKSDVYSYGMMILEMVGGRKKVDARVSHTSEIYFPDWVYEHLEQGSNFGLLSAVTEEEKELARKMILVGLWCIQTKPSDRPSMSKVIEMLEGSTEALQIPPKPVLSSPVQQFTTDKSESIVLLLYINIHKQCNVQDLIRTSNTVDCIF